MDRPEEALVSVAKSYIDSFEGLLDAKVETKLEL